MHDLVKLLYLGNWTESVQKAAHLVPKEQAESIVRELTKSNGWRERVVAAKIIAAHDLSALVPELVRTFPANPEFYTCSAFSKMISQILGAAGVDLLEDMKTHCQDNDYGRNLIRVIDEAISSTKAA